MEIETEKLPLAEEENEEERRMGWADLFPEGRRGKEEKCFAF